LEAAPQPDNPETSSTKNVRMFHWQLDMHLLKQRLLVIHFISALIVVLQASAKLLKLFFHALGPYTHELTYSDKHSNGASFLAFDTETSS